MHAKYWKNFGILGSTEIIMRLKGFVLMPLLTSQLGTVNYGAWAQVSLVASFLPLLIILGTDAAIERFLPGKEQNEKGRMYTAWVIYGIVLSTIFSLISITFREFFSHILFGPGEEFVQFLPLAILFGCNTVILSMGRRWYKILHDALTESLITIAQALVGVIAVLAMYFLDQNVYQLILYTIIGEGLITAVVFLHLISRFGIHQPDFSILPKAIKFGLPMLPAALGLWIITLTDRLFLTHMQGLETVGVFSIGVALAKMISILILRPIRYMYPTYSSELHNQKKYGDFEKFFNLILYLTCLFMLPAIAGLISVGGNLIGILTPESFSDAAQIMPLMAFGLFINAIAGYFSAWVYLEGKSMMLTVSMIMAATLNVILNIILIPEYGMIGAAIASILAYTADFALLTFLALTKHKICAVNMMRLIAPFGASIAMFVTLHLIFIIPPFAAHGNLALLSMKTALGIAIYFGLLFAFGQLPVNDIKRLVLRQETLS